MPFMMIFIFNSFSAALTYYYFLQNVISFGQQFIIKRFFINEEEVIRKMNERKAKPQKKSKFQARLEQMQKQQRDGSKKKRKR
jgi:YidC/Oxa1 family membrane protein insertase